ncbi:MAG: hypothetical protein LAT55_12675, partial [Opitutales bacterium]|nr:hypothetical protein [Opitutales bacterium]
MPPLKGLEVLDEEPPQRMNPQEVAELINHRGKGTYWTDRSLHAYHNRYGRMADTRFDWVEEPVWGQSVSIPAGQEWEEHTLPPMSVIHGRPPSMNAGVVLHGLQNMANYEMVEPGDRARWVHAVLSAELFDTDLALDLADAWMRSAGPTDELLEAYMRRTMVLANAGRLDEIEEIPGPLKTDEAGHRSPWMEEIFISRDKWYRWGRNYSETQKSWQAFRLALALGETGKARETWKAFNEHMEEGNPREKDREWWEENRGHWEAALKRLDEGMNWELSREDIAAVQLWRQFLKGWTYGDFAEQLEDLSDEELFKLIDAAEHLFGPWSMEYADLLLYAVEQRGVWNLDWDTESLMRVSHGMIRSIYHRQRPVPIYYLISQVMAHRPVPTDKREARLHQERRMGSLSAIVAATHGIRLNKAAQEKLYLMLLEEYQEMLGV